MLFILTLTRNTFTIQNTFQNIKTFHFDHISHLYPNKIQQKHKTIYHFNFAIPVNYSTFVSYNN